MILIIIMIVCLVLAGACKAVADTLQFKFAGSIFSRWPKLDPKVSHLNKWHSFYGVDKVTIHKAPFYYLWLYKPEYVERFPYSSTFLVMLTDAWHFANFVGHLSFSFVIGLCLGIIGTTSWLWVGYATVVVMAISGFGFTFCYDFIFIKHGREERK